MKKSKFNINGRENEKPFKSNLDKIAARTKKKKQIELEEEELDEEIEDEEAS